MLELSQKNIGESKTLPLTRPKRKKQFLKSKL